jgi:hypothetical protein
MEKPTSALQIDNGAVILHTRPYEINTIKVRFASKSRNESGQAAQPE